MLLGVYGGAAACAWLKFACLSRSCALVSACDAGMSAPVEAPMTKSRAQVMLEEVRKGC